MTEAIIGLRGISEAWFHKINSCSNSAKNNHDATTKNRLEGFHS